MPQPQLAQIESALADEFPVQALPPSDDAPLGQLAVALDPDEQGRDRAVYLLLVPPINDEDLYGLQYFAPLPFSVSDQDLGDLARLILLINTAVPLVGFGLSEENGMAFFRCILPAAQGRALDPSEALHTLWMIFSLLDRFSETIEAVAMGQKDYRLAHKVVQDILSSLGEEAGEE
jgi:hypothetical protein